MLYSYVNVYQAGYVGIVIWEFCQFWVRKRRWDSWDIACEVPRGMGGFHGTSLWAWHPKPTKNV